MAAAIALHALRPRAGRGRWRRRASIGATNRRISSTSPASRNAPARCGPPSSRIDWMPRAPSSDERGAHARGLVLAGGHDHLDAGDLERVGRAREAAREQIDGPAAPRRRPGRAGESSGRRASESNTTRRGWRVTPSTRAVSSGSSASAVPMPTATASHSARQWCERVRLVLAGDPLRVAAAGGDLAVERHRRLEQHVRAAGRACLRKGWLSSRASRAAGRPGRCRPRRPRRAGCRGRGRRPSRSGRRRRPRRARCRASTIASVHGGVRPWWQHGSSET